MILIIDNTLNLDKAYMTPIIISIIKNYNTKYVIISKQEQLNDLNLADIKGIILSGGSYCLSNDIFFNNIRLNIVVINLLNDIPILGICFGFQLICSIYGSDVYRFDKHVNTNKLINLDSKIDLIGDKNKKVNAYFSHIDYINNAPYNFDYTKYDNIIIAIKHKYKPIYGFQFHPEGNKDTHYIIENFIDITNKINN